MPDQKENKDESQKYQEKKTDDPRNIVRKVYFNKSEFETAESLAKLTGKKLAIYLREASLKNEQSLIKSSAFYLEVKAEIRKVGVNLNQIARILNATKDPNDKDLIRNLREMESKLSDLIKKHV